jgi:hypothetical protein
MYNLTVSTSAGVLRTRGSVAAPQALRDWFSEETTGYTVTCRDQAGASVTKAQLRLETKQTYEASRDADGRTSEEIIVMPKGLQNSNKEIKKPKKDKTVAAAPSTFSKASSEPNGTAKKKV